MEYGLRGIKNIIKGDTTMKILESTNKDRIITVGDLKKLLTKFKDETVITLWNESDDYPDYKVGRIYFANHIYDGLSIEETKNQDLHLDIF